MSEMVVPKESQVKYLRRRLEEVDKIKASFSAQVDWELIKKMGHQIKGNAATFGFPLLAERGLQLEQAALAQNLPAVRELSARLESEVRALLLDAGARSSAP